MTERRQPRARWGALAALAVGLLVLLTPLNERWSRPLLDAQLRLLAPDKPPTGVLVFDIDDASLAALQPQFGPWPYKRDVYALAIENLRALGARAVALDLLLVDAQPGDTALARTLARPGAPVVLAAAGLRHFSGPVVPLPAAARLPPLPAPAHRWPTIAMPTASVWPEPHQPPAVGVITTPTDADGVLRRLPLWHEAEGRRWPVLPHALHQLLAPQAASAPLPLDASGALHFAFAPASAAPPVLPLSRLFLRETGEGRAGRESRDGAATDDEALRQRVQGRVVFIGSSALLGDAVMTVQGQVSGTQVLAQAYAALRDGHWIRPPLAWANATLLCLALLPALASVRRRRPQPRRDIAAHAAALLAVAALAAWLLLQMRLPTLWAAPLAALAAGLGTALLLHARQQAAAQQRLAQELAVTAEAARAKGQFLANVSHEIRTPLNAVMGVAELLAESDLTDTQRRQVQLFQEAGQTLHALINDLLDLSKIEANRLELENAPFALHALLKRLVALLQAQAQRKGLALRLELAPGLPAAVSGDSLRLERALTNLVANAVKFTARGEVLLRARPDPSLPDGLCFEVIDTGIGIAPSKLESIFEPFSQADGSVTRLYGGTGLGLALTRSVTRLLGGTVEVQSTPGQGSVFTLRLPLPAAELPAVAAVAEASAADARPGAGAPAGGTPATQAAATAGAAAAAGMPARRRVLLAEDNEVNSYLFTAMLADEGLDIDLAPNGLAAWEMLRRQAYDIAFIDVQMPGLDGLSLTRQWRAHEREAGLAPLPMVSLTANAFASDVQASRESGSSLHLPKPCSKQQLLDALHSLAPVPRAAPQTPAHALADVEPSFDPVLSRQRLGADPAAFQRVVEHAEVFLDAWPADFSRARAEGETGHAQGLADDLLDVAKSLGAQGLTAQAVMLRDALAGGNAEAVLAARLRVQQALAPVLLALLQAA